MIASFFGDKWSKTLFLLGIYFLFLAPFIIGWIPSIYWGVLIVKKSWAGDTEMQEFIGENQVRSDDNANRF